MAAFVQPSGKSSVLDVGAGVGAVSLCLAAHHPEVQITGLEVQEEIINLAEKNAVNNDVQGRVKFIRGDLSTPPKEIPLNSFDHVVTNPPYFEKYSKSIDASKSKARHVQDLGLEGWIEACLKFVKPRGFFTLILRADQIDKIITSISAKAGALKIMPLWPAIGKSAKLILVSARKGVKTKAEFLPGYILHEKTGKKIFLNCFITKVC